MVVVTAVVALTLISRACVHPAEVPHELYIGHIPEL